MDLFSIGYLITFLVLLFVGSIVLSRDIKQALNRVFFFYCLASAVVAFSELHLLQALEENSAFFWLHYSSLWPFIFSFQMHFLLIYTKNDRLLRSVFTYVVIYLLPLIYVISFFIFQNEILDVAKLSWGWRYAIPEDGVTVINIVAGVWAGLFSVTVIVLSIIHYFKVGGTRRRQTRYILIGVTLPLVVGLLEHRLFMPMGIELPDISTYGVGFGALVITVGIVRYGLFDMTPGKRC